MQGEKKLFTLGYFSNSTIKNHKPMFMIHTVTLSSLSSQFSDRDSAMYIYFLYILKFWSNNLGTRTTTMKTQTLSFLIGSFCIPVASYPLLLLVTALLFFNHNYQFITFAPPHTPSQRVPAIPPQTPRCLLGLHLI